MSGTLKSTKAKAGATTKDKAYFPLSNTQLLTLLRDGGNILYARHGEASIGEDQQDLNFQYCSTQRNLSNVGRIQAINYGEIFRVLRIPIKSPILASPFSRTRETAELAFGKEDIQVDPFWGGVLKLYGNSGDDKQKILLEAIKSALEIRPPPGSNKLIISHSFQKGEGLGRIPNMGTVVVKPRGQDDGYKKVTLKKCWGAGPDPKLVPSLVTTLRLKALN